MTNPHDKAIEAARDAINAILARDSFAASSGDMAEAAIAAYERAMWRPIEEAPIPERIAVDEGWVLGRTTHGNIVAVRYMPDGDYKDNWGHDNVRYVLTHFRPLPPAPEGK